jgi:hypothetical protein
LLWVPTMPHVDPIPVQEDGTALVGVSGVSRIARKLLRWETEFCTYCSPILSKGPGTERLNRAVNVAESVNKNESHQPSRWGKEGGPWGGGLSFRNFSEVVSSICWALQQNRHLAWR